MSVWELRGTSLRNADLYYKGEKVDHVKHASVAYSQEEQFPVLTIKIVMVNPSVSVLDNKLEPYMKD